MVIGSLGDFKSELETLWPLAGRKQVRAGCLAKL